MNTPKGPLVSAAILTEASVKYDGWNIAAVLAVAGKNADTSGLHPVITAANGKKIPLEPGQWVVRYAAKDMGIMDDGEYQRHSWAEPS